MPLKCQVLADMGNSASNKTCLGPLVISISLELP